MGLLFSLLQSCKKDSASLNQNLSYSVSDTLGKVYSFSDYVSSIWDSMGVTRYYFNGNNDFYQYEPDAVIYYNRLGSNDYFFVFIIESSYFIDLQNGINLPRNAIYMEIPNLQNINTQVIRDARNFLTLRLNNINQIAFNSFAVTTKCIQNQDNTVSGTFTILAYMGTGNNHYTITGHFNNAKLE